MSWKNNPRDENNPRDDTETNLIGVTENGQLNQSKIKSPGGTQKLYSYREK